MKIDFPSKSGQKLVPVSPRRAPSTAIVPDDPLAPGAKWWLENVDGKLPSLSKKAPPKVVLPPKPEEILVTETKEQFDLLQTAVDAVESNKDFEQAVNTASSYAYEWRTFVAWCGERGQRALPASAAAVRAYIADVSSRERPRRVKPSSKARSPDAPPIKPKPPRKPGGLAVALSAIRWYHRKFDYPSPHDHPIVQEELERIRRRVGVAPTRKHPLTVQHLEQIVAVLEAERQAPAGKTKLERAAAVRRAIRNKALLLIGFAGAFRRSELAELVLGDVFMKPQGFDATVQKSKTDQLGAGHVKAIPAGRAGAGTCPKKALEEWLAAARIEDDGPIFREIDRCNRLVLNRTGGQGLGVGLTGDAVALVVKEYLEKIGVDPKSFSGHSLRAGLITAAAEDGRDVYEIMATTGHKHPGTVFVYIRSAQRFDRAASQGLL